MSKWLDRLLANPELSAPEEEIEFSKESDPGTYKTYRIETDQSEERETSTYETYKNTDEISKSKASLRRVLDVREIPSTWLGLPGGVLWWLVRLSKTEDTTRQKWLFERFEPHYRKHTWAVNEARRLLAP